MKKHGYSKSSGKHHPLYVSWLRMKERCLYAHHPFFSDYGGRGVKVCDRWLHFTSFLEDMGPSWSRGMTLDRFPNKAGNYEPGNVRWSTRKQQANNRRNNRLITHNGETMTVTEWARRTGMSPVTLGSRLDHGWSPSDAITRPIQIHRRSK